MRDLLKIISTFNTFENQTCRAGPMGWGGVGWWCVCECGGGGGGGGGWEGGVQERQILVLNKEVLLLFLKHVL